MNVHSWNEHTKKFTYLKVPLCFLLEEKSLIGKHKFHTVKLRGQLNFNIYAHAEFPF